MDSINRDNKLGLGSDHTYIDQFGGITLSKINNKHKSEQLDKVLKYKGSIQIEEGNQKDSLRINKLK